MYARHCHCAQALAAFTALDIGCCSCLPCILIKIDENVMPLQTRSQESQVACTWRSKCQAAWAPVQRTCNFKRTVCGKHPPQHFLAFHKYCYLPQIPFLPGKAVLSNCVLLLAMLFHMCRVGQFHTHVSYIVSSFWQENNANCCIQIRPTLHMCMHWTLQLGLVTNQKSPSTEHVGHTSMLMCTLKPRQGAP